MTVVDKEGKALTQEFKPFEMGMQVSCDVYRKIPDERVVWDDSKFLKAVLHE
jgi:hypothetical protein